MPRHGLLLLLLTCSPAVARWRTSKVGDRIVTDGSRLPMATGQTVFSLARRAVALQESWSSTAGTDAYALGDDEPCAWANWLMPERLLIGESPIGASAAEISRDVVRVGSGPSGAFESRHPRDDDDGTRLCFFKVISRASAEHAIKKRPTEKKIQHDCGATTSSA